MEQLRLVSPDESMAEEIRAYRQAMLDAGSSMDGTGPLRRLEDPLEWIRSARMVENPETCPAHLVDASQLVCVRENDGRIVGMIDIRHRLNDHLRLYGGHIGYSVRPDERRKGYATWMLRRALDICRERGMDKVLVMCLSSNEGSRHTILKCGGVHETQVFDPEDQEDLEHYWITL